jgi:hypothetical protein
MVVLAILGLTACEPTYTVVGEPDWYGDHVPAASHVDLTVLPLSDTEAKNLARDFEAVLDSQMFRYSCTPTEIEALAILFAMHGVDADEKSNAVPPWTQSQTAAVFALDARFKAIATEQSGLSPACAAAMKNLG